MKQPDDAVDALDLARALLDNADELLSDAELLLANGRIPRAGALAVMASEELSKLYLCLGAITGESDVPSSKSSEWRDHRNKLQTAKALDIGFIDTPLNLDMDEAKSAVDELLRLKMSCLYVDHHNGKVGRPSDLDVNAPSLIQSGRAQRALLRGVFGQITPEVLEAMHLHYDEMSQIAEALIDQQHPEQSLARLRSVVAATAKGDAAALKAALVEGLDLAGIHHVPHEAKP